MPILALLHRSSKHVLHGIRNAVEMGTQLWLAAWPEAAGRVHATPASTAHPTPTLITLLIGAVQVQRVRYRRPPSSCSAPTW